MAVRWLALWLWAYATWLVLTWTVALEQLLAGALLALAVALAMAPLGKVVPPWRLLRPRVLGAVVWLVANASVRIAVANVGLARRILSPRRPLASGMVVVPTALRSEAGLGAAGLISSLVVDNQIVDLDRRQHVLQYHAVAVPADRSTGAKVAAINGPIERLVDLVLDAAR